MSGLSILQKPAIHLGVGFALAETVRLFKFERWAADTSAFILSGLFSGTLQTLADLDIARLEYGTETKASPLSTVLEKVTGVKDPDKRKTEEEIRFISQFSTVLTVALAFFTNLIVSVINGNYRSLANVVLMTGLNFAAGTGACKALRSYGVIA